MDLHRLEASTVRRAMAEAFALSVALAAASCGKLPEPDPPEYVRCPETPVALEFFDELEYGGETYRLYKADIAFGPPEFPTVQDCEHPLLPEAVVRGTSSAVPESVHLVFGDDSWETWAGFNVGTAAAAWNTPGGWASLCEVPWPASGRVTGPYFAAFPRVGEDPLIHGDVSIQFLYDCGCIGSPYDCTYIRTLDQTMQFAKLDLVYGEFEGEGGEPIGRVLLDPDQPHQHQEFVVRWITRYESDPCIDALGESGPLRIGYETHELAEAFGATHYRHGLVGDLPSVPVGGEVQMEFTHPALDEPGAYFMILELDPIEHEDLLIPPESCECARDEDVRANNRTSIQFLVEGCSCPPGRGNLSLRVLESYSTGGGTKYVKWRPCYSGWCDVSTGATGEFVERITMEHLRTFEDPMVLERTVGPLTMGECGPSNEFTFPDDLERGEYRLTIELDAHGDVVECPGAPAEDQVLVEYFSVD